MGGRMHLLLGLRTRTGGEICQALGFVLELACLSGGGIGILGGGTGKTGGLISVMRGHAGVLGGVIRITGGGTCMLGSGIRSIGNGGGVIGDVTGVGGGCGGLIAGMISLAGSIDDLFRRTFDVFGCQIGLHEIFLDDLTALFGGLLDGGGTLGGIIRLAGGFRGIFGGGIAAPGGLGSLVSSGAGLLRSIISSLGGIPGIIGGCRGGA
jgi:hypothetical protein